jgi:hypothetical protein
MKSSGGSNPIVRAVGLVVATAVGIFLLPFWPLIVLLGYPVLLISAIVFPLYWFVGLRRGVSRRLCQLAAYWVLGLGIVLTVHGIIMSMDTALAGAPPTEQEKQFGRRVASTGGGLAVLAAFGAYALDAGWSRSKPRTIAILDDLPPGP